MLQCKYERCFSYPLRSTDPHKIRHHRNKHNPHLSILSLTILFECILTFVFCVLEHSDSLNKLEQTVREEYLCIDKTNVSFTIELYNNINRPQRTDINWVCKDIYRWCRNRFNILTCFSSCHNLNSIFFLLFRLPSTLKISERLTKYKNAVPLFPLPKKK